MTETLVAVDGGEVWADDSGGAGRPLVLLHPGVGDSRIWDGILPALTPKYRVIRYDARGFGRSPAATEEYSQLLDLLAVLDHFGIERAHFSGCSGGGGTVVDLALAEPARVRSMVLLAPGISGYAWPAEPELDAEFDALVAAGDEDRLVDLTIRIWGAAGPDPFISDLARSATRALGSQRFQRPDPPAFDCLGEITAPSVIMVGDLDRPGLIESNEQAAARIPGCTLIRMAGADHYPTVRDPELVLETIRSHCTD
jgi:3-oxoadipate enol-lactonase